MVPQQSLRLRCVRCRIVTTASLIALVLTACSQDKLNELVDKAKTAAAEGTEKMKQAVEETKGVMDRASTEVQEGLQLAGKIELTAGVPITTAACYVEFLPQGGSRAAVFQLRSYRDGASESFPSVFLHAQTAANSLEELAAEGTVQCRLFIQLEPNGAVLFSEVAQPVELRIQQLDEQTMTAEIASGTLRDTRSDQTVTVTGTFQGVR